MAISSTTFNLNSLYTQPTSPKPTTTRLSSSNSSFLTNTFKPLNLVHAHRPCKKTGFSVNCMFGLGVPELAVIAGVATLVFGPKALPEIGRNFGKTLKSFQQAAKEFETELKKEDPESLEESSAAVNEMVDQENKDAKSTQAAKEFETELKKEDPESLEESTATVSEMVDQENKDANSTQVSL